MTLSKNVFREKTDFLKNFISVLQKAGRHMEDTLIASYVTLIIGYLIKDNKVRNGILERLGY